MRLLEKYTPKHHRCNNNGVFFFSLPEIKAHLTFSMTDSTTGRCQVSANWFSHCMESIKNIPATLINSKTRFGMGIAFVYMVWLICASAKVRLMRNDTSRTLQCSEKHFKLKKLHLFSPFLIARSWISTFNMLTENFRVWHVALGFFLHFLWALKWGEFTPTNKLQNLYRGGHTCSGLP